MNNAFKLKMLILAGVLLTIAACKKDARTNWDTEMLVPIATSNLTLQNLVKDSGVVTNPDQSLTLAYKSTLFQFNLADRFIRIPDTSIGQRFTLDSLRLPNQNIVFNFSLGYMANAMLQNPGTAIYGQFLIGNNGNTTAIPAINGINTPPFHLDATSYFDSAVLLSGVAQLWVVNNFPIPISGGTLELRNTSDGSLVASQGVPYINSRDSAYIQIPIGGSRITGGLDFYVKNLSSPGSNGVAVPIDTNDQMRVRMFITAMRVSEAWAKFPTQDLVSVTEDVTQLINDRKFTYVDARSGSLHIFITSSIEEKMYLEYTLVGAYDKTGRPLKVNTVVPAAPVNGTVTIDSVLDISGVAINLTGKDGTRFNTYTQRVVARIDSSGITRHITASDSLNITYQITEIAPNYVKGYAGVDTFSQVDTAAFGFLDMFQSGTLDLEDVNMKLSVENGIGVDGEVRINSLKATSPVNGTRTLTGSVLGQPLVVNRATDFPLTPAVNNFTINNSNSNIKDLLGILPTQLQYDVAVRTNLNGNNGQYRDFAYLESALKLNLNAEVPLSFIASHLMLRDTFDFNLSNTNLNVAGISDGVINLIANNKYPIEANLTFIMYDENWVGVDTFLIDTRVQPGELDNNCRVNAFKKTKIPLYINEDRMENVKRARKAVIVADFSTSSNNATCNGQHLKVYSDYALDLTFTARFNYKVKVGF